MYKSTAMVDVQKSDKISKVNFKGGIENKFAKILSSVMFQEKQVIFFNKIKKKLL